MVEPEVAFNDSDANMRLQESFVSFIVARALDRRREELKELERDITPQLSVGTYIDFNVKFLLVFGCAFEMPLVLTILARAGVVSAQMLARYRKHAIMTALIVSAIVTPDATLFTMLLMAVPLVVFSPDDDIAEVTRRSRSVVPDGTTWVELPSFGVDLFTFQALQMARHIDRYLPAE